MEIVDLVKYILENYPYPNELSKARLNKIIYLVDWRSVLINNRQLTNIEWKYNHYGPYVDIIKKQIQADSRFKIDNTTNFYGNPKELITLVEYKGFLSPNEDEKQVIDFVIEKTKRDNSNNWLATHKGLLKQKNNFKERIKPKDLFSDYYNKDTK